jgi:hypothetical protein
MPTSQDLSRSDLTIMTWQWLDAEYAEYVRCLTTFEPNETSRTRCQVYAEIISHLTGIPVKTVKRTAKERHENAGS